MAKTGFIVGAVALQNKAEAREYSRFIYGVVVLQGKAEAREYSRLSG